MSVIAVLISAASLVCAHAAEADQPLPFNWVIVVAGIAAVVVIGLGLMIYQTPKDMRGPGNMFKVKTLNGIESFPQVILPNVLPAATVTLVAVPLSLALGIATGTTPMTAIATAIMGGLVSGTFGDSAFNVVGPAGALVGILMRFTATYGAEVLPWLSLMSACMITLTILLRLHEYCMLMPKAVFEGFTVSVALTIGFGQTDFAFGLRPGDPLKIEGLELSPGIWKLGASIKAFGTIQASSTIFFLVGFTTMYVLFKIKPSIPWMVPFAFVACFIGALCDEDALGVIPLDLPNLRSKYGILGFWAVQGLKPLTQIVAEANDGEGGSYGELLTGALSVTIVAVLETLISAQIAKSRSKMPYDDVKELQGLALSHFACGICGLMPPTGVFVRTSVNLSTGATHKTSQAIQGFLIFVFAAMAMRFVSYIPQGGIAAILVMSCVRMVPWGYVQKLWKEQKWHFGLLCVVALVCWIADSVTGLVVGTMVALLVTGKETARGHAEISITAAGNKRLDDGSPEMISIDALAVDKVDLARRKVEGDSESGSEDSSSDESELESQLASTAPNYSHMAYAPEFDQFSRQESDQFGRQVSDQFGRQVSVTPNLFAGEGNQRLTPTTRGDRVFLYKFLGQLDFLAGDRHVDRVQGILKSGPKAMVFAMQNVPWVDPDGLEALRDMIAMLGDNDVQVYLACPRPKVTEVLEKEAWYQEKIGSGQFVYSTEKSALISALGKSHGTDIDANANNITLVGS